MKLALPFPRRSTAPGPPARSHERQGFPFRMLIALIIVLALSSGLWFWRARATQVGTTTTLPAPVTQGNLTILVESSGAVASSNQLILPFRTSGAVEEVQVEPGDMVKAGQPLARLETAELRLKLQQAEAALQTAQARLDQSQSGNATPQDIDAAQASLVAAEAQLQKTRATSTNDVRSAEAALRLAQAQLDALKNPSADKLATAQTTLAQAEANLRTTRDNASAAKTNAERALQEAANILTQAQAAFSKAEYDWEYVQATGSDPAAPTTANAEGKRVPNTLSDSERAQYYSAFAQAQAALRNAESAVQTAQVNYDTARQGEVSQVQQAEAQVANAAAQLEALRQPSQTATIQAQAQVDQARAHLDTLRQGGTAGDISAAQAQVDQSRASLDKLTAPASSAEIAIARAGVAEAQAQLDAAKLALANATLNAPADGVVAAVEVASGNMVSAGTAAITLIDNTNLQVDLNVSEADIGRVVVGQPVSLTFDALADVSVDGTVQAIAPVATEGQNTVTYQVTVGFPRGDERIKIGMTANAAIEVEKHTGVMQVPTRAITTRGPVKTIDVYTGQGETTATIQVETGASNGAMTEITSCVQIGKQCLREGDRVALKLASTAASQGGPSSGNEIMVGQPGMGPAGPQQIIIKP